MRCCPRAADSTSGGLFILFMFEMPTAFPVMVQEFSPLSGVLRRQEALLLAPTIPEWNVVVHDAFKPENLTLTGATLLGSYRKC